MIEGFQFSITVGEAADHFRSRAQHHEARAAMYQGQLNSLRETLKEAERIAGSTLVDKASNGLSNSYGYSDPVTSLQQRVAHHRKRGFMFRFAADHLPQGETFRVRPDQLGAFEFDKVAADQDDDS